MDMMMSLAPPRALLEHDPEKLALGRDPGVETGFPKRSCLIKTLECQSIQPEAIAL
jgi:hypothetical protein